jgi:hypothetical protein
LKYALLIYGTETGWDSVTDEERQMLYKEYDAFGHEAEQRGLMRGGEELTSVSSATTVRVRDGETLVTDGPFAETKEQLGGFFLLECEDADEAIEMAAKIPGARSGSIEVRPCMEQHPDAAHQG